MDKFASILSSQALVSDVDTGLLLEINNGVNGNVPIELRWLSQFEDGSVVENRQTFTAGSLSTSSQFFTNLGKGRLLSASVRCVSSASQYGRVFAILSYVKGAQTATPNTSLLVSGYITDDTPINYPLTDSRPPHSVRGGVLDIQTSDPAAGNEIAFQLFASARYRWIGGIFSLTTSATVATRQVNIIVVHGGQTVLLCPANATQAASLTRQYIIWVGPNLPAASGSRIFIPLPNEIELDNMTMQTSTDNLQAGDDFTALNGVALVTTEPSIL